MLFKVNATLDESITQKFTMSMKGTLVNIYLSCLSYIYQTLRQINLYTQLSGFINKIHYVIFKTNIF